MSLRAPMFFIGTKQSPFFILRGLLQSLCSFAMTILHLSSTVHGFQYRESKRISSFKLSCSVDVEKTIIWASSVNDIAPLAYPAGRKRTAGIASLITNRCTFKFFDGAFQSSISTPHRSAEPFTTVKYFPSFLCPCHARMKPCL